MNICLYAAKLNSLVDSVDGSLEVLFPTKQRNSVFTNAVQAMLTTSFQGGAKMKIPKTIPININIYQNSAEVAENLRVRNFHFTCVAGVPSVNLTLFYFAVVYRRL